MANIYMSGGEWGTMYELSWWTGYTGVSTTYARTGEYSYYTTGDIYAGHIGISPSGDYSELYLQYGLYIPDTFDCNILSFYGNYGMTRYGKLYLTNSGQILMYTNELVMPDDRYYDMETLVLRSSSFARLTSYTWHVIEVHLKYGVSGVFELRIDGVMDMTWYGRILPPSLTVTNISSFTWGTSEGIGDPWSLMYMDDIIINDTSGDYNNSWPGCVKVDLLRPSAVGLTTQWIPATEPWNYDQVNDVPVDTTDYVYTYDVNKRDLYELQDLPADADTVPILRSDAWAFKNSGLTLDVRTLRFPINTTAGICVSHPHELATSYRLISHVWDVDPGTGVPWTAEEVNAMQAGIESETLTE